MTWRRWVATMIAAAAVIVAIGAVRAIAEMVA